MNPLSAVANGVGILINFVDSLIPDAQGLPDRINILDFQTEDNSSLYILLGLGVLLLLLLGAIVYLAARG